MNKIQTSLKALARLVPYLLLPLTVIIWALVLKNEFIYVIKWWAVLLFIGFLFSNVG